MAEQFHSYAKTKQYTLIMRFLQIIQLKKLLLLLF